MIPRHEATRGVLLVFAAIVALTFAIFNARHHFASLTADARFPSLESSVRARRSFDPTLLVPHAFDHVPLDEIHAIGAIDLAEDLDRRLHVSGWIVTPSRAPGTHVVAIIDEVHRIEITADYGRQRPDVVRALGTATALRSGIDGVFTLPKLARGEHHLTFAVASDDGHTLLALEAERSFRVP